MGTRHLVCVVNEGKYEVSEYGRNDGFPKSAGLEILDFLKDDFIKEKMIDGLANISFSDKPTNNGFVGRGVLDFVQNNTEPATIEEYLAYATNPSMCFPCEWAYVLDLDNDTFEVYKGGNKKPLADTERFAIVAKMEGYEWGTEKTRGPYGDITYQPVKLAASWYFSKLPTEDEFLKKFPDND